MRLAKIFICLLSVAFATNSFAEENCAIAESIIYKMALYNCPNKDESLAELLMQSATNAAYVNAVCAANSASCSAGVFSYVNEANGLAVITQKNNSKYCYIAEEDQAQLTWYLVKYMSASCSVPSR